MTKHFFFLEKRKPVLKEKIFFFGKAFFFKERFLVVLVHIGIWDFQDKEALTQK